MIVAAKTAQLFRARGAGDAIFFSGASDPHAVGALENSDIRCFFVQLQPFLRISGAAVDLSGALNVVRLRRHMIADDRVQQRGFIIDMPEADGVANFVGRHPQKLFL